MLTADNWRLERGNVLGPIRPGCRRAHWKLGSQRYATSRLDPSPVPPKVPFRLERPVQTPHYPVREPVYVHTHVGIDRGAPRGQTRAVVLEPIDRALAKLTDDVDGVLEV